MSAKRFYTASSIFTGQEWLEDYAVAIEAGRIAELVPLRELRQPIEHLGDHILAPAFIDLQVYGAGGKLFSLVPDPDSLAELVAHNRQSGCSLCLPTVATNSIEVFQAAIDAVRSYWEKGVEGILGLHLEGPWINPKRKGAHLEKYIHSPSMEEVKALLEYGKGVIRMITLAPECCSPDIIHYIHSSGIKISAGHSDASFTAAIQGFKEGISLVTHLYNAMSPLQHREPGLAGAAMSDDHVMASIIPDGIHVSWPALRIAKKVMGSRLFVITDAVTSAAAGDYQHIFAGDRYEANGVLSGSALTMEKALKNLLQEAGIEMGEALRMCSLYPAIAAGLEHERGRIAPGHLAEMVLLERNGAFIKMIN